jgi:glycosyltransferase involved in cell wall biosynthesis
VRILALADEVPWPPTSGYRIRLDTTLRALAAIGQVDLWCVLHDERGAEAASVPPGEWGATRIEVRLDPVRRSPVQRLVRWVAGRRPRELAWHDERANRRALAGFARPPYDLVWYSGAATFLRFSGVVEAPTIVDFVDLPDGVLAHRRAVPVSSRRERAARLADGIDERRWRRLQQRIALNAAAVVVCSEIDRARFGAAKACVVPNVYRAPEPPATGHDPPAAGGDLLFVGLLTYPPNTDAVRFLAREVLPRVRERVPDARARVVGRHDGVLADLESVPGLQLLGPVDDLDPVLRAADVAVVPIRYGGGTRVKILEAFAYRIPVVSTVIGCEGLDVEPERELLVADDAPAFAGACVRLLTDAECRTALTAAAFARWDADHRPEAAMRLVRQLVVGVAGGTA